MAKKLSVLVCDRVEECFDRIGDLIKLEPLGAEMARELDLPDDWVAGVQDGGNARLRVEVALLLASRMSRSDLLRAVVDLRENRIIREAV